MLSSKNKSTLKNIRFLDEIIIKYYLIFFKTLLLYEFKKKARKLITFKLLIS